MFSGLRQRIADRATPLSSGDDRVDDLLGGGIPPGHVVEVSGAESSGKATLAFSVCRRALERGQAAAWIDPAGAFWPVGALERGASLQKMLVVRAPDGPGALRAAQILLSSAGAVAVLVIDLPAPLPARAWRPRDRELVALQRLAERSATALLFLTERSREAPSLGAQVALRLHVERRAGGALRVEVLRNKLGASQRAVEQRFGAPPRGY